MDQIKIITHLPIERWEEYKTLKLEALKESPQAFWMEYEEGEKEPPEYWKKDLGQNSLVVFAGDNKQLVGFISGRVYSKKMFKHNALLDTIFVKANYRGRGVGELLEKTLVDMLSKNSKIINIFAEVSSSQEASLALQKKLGFEIVGVTKDFGFYNGKYYDDVHFVKRISNSKSR